METTFTEQGGNAIEQRRYDTLRNSLRHYRDLIEHRVVLDFGASSGLSAIALIEIGATSVYGVEPDRERVERGKRLISQMGISDQVSLVHVADTRHLGVPDESFDLVLANAVLEHIPQPRDAYIKEMWRVLKRGGTLFINETPNKYLPADFHTLKLPLTNWLPSRLAHWIGTATGRFDRARTDWKSSGWRGMGVYELAKAIPGRYVMQHEMTRRRHRILRAVGLPSGLLDPYPLYVIRKM